MVICNCGEKASGRLLAGFGLVLAASLAVGPGCSSPLTSGSEAAVPTKAKGTSPGQARRVLVATVRPSHEPLLVCRRGRLPFALNNVPSVQPWALLRSSHNGGRIHSAKPDGALDLIERASPGPYLECFARRAHFGWDYWGDESLGTAQMPGKAA